MRHRHLLSCTVASVLTLGAAAAPAQRVPLDSLERAARADSLDPIAHYNLALGHLRDRRYNEAEHAFQEALRLDPRLAEAHLGVAVVQDNNRRYWQDIKRGGGDTAVTRERENRSREYRRAFMLDPFVDMTPLFYADRHLTPEEIPQGLEEAYQYFLRLEGLYGGYRNALLVDSLPPWLLWVHGLLATASGHPGHAIVDISALARVARTWEARDTIRAVPLRTNDFLYMQAAIETRVGSRTRALVLFNEVLTNDVGYYMAHVRLAQLHESRQEWSQALTHRRAAIATNPDDPTLQLDLAQTLIAARFAGRAESLLIETQAVLPRDPRLFQLMGRAEEALGKPAEARAAYVRFLELAPSRWTDAITDARQRVGQIEAH